MITVHMVSPTLEHYTCLVDLIGLAGHLHEAENTTKAMPCKPHVSAWNALLRACRIHGNVELEKNEFLIWTLKMLQAMCCYQKSMLLLAPGNRHFCEKVEPQRKD